MARHDGVFTKGYARQTNAPVPDITIAAQNGITPSYATFHGAAPYVSRQVMCILLEAPTGFKLLENGDHYVATLRSLMEDYSREIDGLQSNITYEWDSIEVGGAGEILEVPVNAKRARSEPQHTMDEVYNLGITRFYDNWMRMLVMDPETKYAGIVSQDNVPDDLLPDRYTGTALYMETDPTAKFVLKAWLVTNMAPKDGYGDVMKGRRKLGDSAQKSEIQVTYTALTMVGVGVNRLAEKILARMNKRSMNPHLHKAWLDDVSADVSAHSAVGMEAGMNRRANNLVVP